MLKKYQLKKLLCTGKALNLHNTMFNLLKNYYYGIRNYRQLCSLWNL